MLTRQQNSDRTTAKCTYCSSCFKPEQKSTLSIVADMLGAAGGFAGK